LLFFCVFVFLILYFGFFLIDRKEKKVYGGGGGGGGLGGGGGGGGGGGAECLRLLGCDAVPTFRHNVLPMERREPLA